MITALVVVDMQNYYLKENSSFFEYYHEKYPGSMDYLNTRSQQTVIPNIRKLIAFFHQLKKPVYYLRICGQKEDRSDLHRFFKTAHDEAEHNSYSNLYPLCNDPMADIIEELRPESRERVFNKKTFSPFNSTDIQKKLDDDGIHTLVFTGLATSQCVETSARDASDRGFTVINIDDAQVDYTEESHFASLYSSQPVCGGWVYDTEYLIEHFDSITYTIHNAEGRPL
ncbi:MAG: cysteine hydrolase [Spirochaetes bacterium]|jgi:nicotinamidase-related amidase|nr:cysteine hydrolase [Spirochaetota bacterium]